MASSELGRRAAAVVRAALLMGLGTLGGTPGTVTPPSPAEPESAPAETRVEPLSAVTRAEGLLQLGHPAAALAALRELPAAAQRHPIARRVTLYALLAEGRFDELRDLLATSALSRMEGAYLAALADTRTHRARGREALAELWWTEPDSVFGLAALRALTQVPGGGYAAGERDAVLATVPAPTPTSYLEDPEAAATVLATLERETPRRGRLAVEVALALGVYALRTEHFTEATGHLTRALGRATHPELRRAIELRLGEARRRQGDFAAALEHFERVAARGDDTLGASARAASGQMAIEQQRYADAQRIFSEQLLDNPVGEARATALFGLGWVAFRTGAFGQARQFFWTLSTESPFGPLAPAAAYWGARALEELGERARAGAELAALAGRFPFDYYAHRARARGGLPLDGGSALPPARARPELRQLETLVDGGMHRRSRALLKRVLAARDLGPHELDALALAAARLGLEAQADLARERRCERYGAGPLSPCPELAQRFPREVVAGLAERAELERLDPEWLVAGAVAASGLDAGHTGDRGELGLFQLSRSTLAALAREERRRSPSAHDVLDPDANLRWSARYFSRVVRPFDGRLEYGLAAFAAGPGAVTRWREARGELPADIFVEEIPYAETRDFVRRALAALATYRALAARPAARELARAD